MLHVIPIRMWAFPWVTECVVNEVSSVRGASLGLQRVDALAGISKGKARLDEWWKDIAPSGQLRKWVHHDMGRWEEFKSYYKQELRQNKGRQVLPVNDAVPGSARVHPPVAACCRNWCQASKPARV